MKSIHPLELFSIMKNGQPVQVIDVRTPAEFEALHVAGCRNIPLDELEAASLIKSGEIKPDLPLFLICLSGSRASKAADQFSKAGIKDPVVVQGGTNAWVSAGIPAVRGHSRVISLERQVRIAAGSLVLCGTLLGLFVHPGFFGLAAFVGGGLVFAGITDFCGMGLLLARLPFNKRRTQLSQTSQ